ncbi:MAG: sulfatase [Armatimonadota bacterium]|nr:MAG: sulfatase [Armatimonadota bacterium]
MNCVLIIVDSWRMDHCGCYGNEWIRTPNLDALAAESVLFTRAYPESFPTLPVRRALHTGRRVYPFRGHRPQKGDFVGAPGWGPIEENLDTVAELLHAQGYRTAFITDTYHQFKPSKNFHRGFDEWRWIRGQEHDCYRSGPVVGDDAIARHMRVERCGSPRWEDHRRYLTNVADRSSEADYFAAQVFRAGAEWLGQNDDAEKFFLVIDSFDPHEPWDPPAYYRRLYDPDDDVVDVIWSTYASADEFPPRELKRMQANYAGECTMVDRWLGHFMESLRSSGRLEDTVVALISDHGHNLGDANLTGKQGYPLTRAVADLIMMIRRPNGEAAGTECDALCYNLDLTVTLMKMLGQEIPDQMEGIDLWPVVRGEQSGREYVTVAWGPEVTFIDSQWWCNDVFWGANPLLYDIQSDPALTRNLAAEHPEVVQKALKMFENDAGGEFPDWLRGWQRMPGCTPILSAED